MTAWLLFLKALALVESGGNPEAIGDGGDSWGMYQLQAAYVQDASAWGAMTHENANESALNWLYDHTQVIQLDSGAVIIQDW